MKLLVQQPVLAPYRLPVFKSLTQLPSCSTTFAASDVASTGETSNEAEKCLPFLRLGYLRLPAGFVWQSGLLRALKSHRPDVLVIGYDPHYLSSVFAARVARKSGYAVVMWGHGLHMNSGRVARWLYRRLADSADALVFYAEDGAKRCIGSGVDEQKVFVAWNSIDTSGIDRLRNSTAFAARHRVVYLGRLTPAKKPTLAIRAFARALPSLPKGTLLTMIGDGPEREACEHEAARLGVQDHVEFAGGVYDDEVLAGLMNEAWVCLSPGYVGLSAIHSLAFGVPMLFARDEKHSPEVSALVVGVNALDFKSDDEIDFSKQLVLLGTDRDFGAHLGQNGTEVVRARFSVEAMSSSLKEAFAYAKLVVDRRAERRG